mmetsp:Transcript_28113/g.61988  ORF Transcript_28113/g.61988 Transcript_28113/m.61988 type:complete len:640 (+) Transcript_28113:118-2037(+)|eukprot:CAMPEP_0204273060 /NCGR_PEP_ID=MMETSP0468-20130131/22456_1 /ASSEMBLY_ACC=CAM_ASM_000383 /TAXON_ID=2969 /ORGANISM="Oxyrrhis marina" /LENGTH=639 /DNA_ID=CAMNT_0051248989 /DNA_START=118 /DNA_END=2037 /DNA_ORIENTATION=-
MSTLSERETPARVSPKDVVTPSTAATTRSDSEATPEHTVGEMSPKQRKGMSSVAASLPFGAESPFAARTPLLTTPSRPWKSPCSFLGTPPAKTPNPAMYMPTPDPFERNTWANHLAMGSITEMLTNNAGAPRDMGWPAGLVGANDYGVDESTSLAQVAADPSLPAVPPPPPALSKGLGTMPAFSPAPLPTPEYLDLLAHMAPPPALYPPFGLGVGLDLLAEEAMLRETALMMALAAQRTVPDFGFGMPDLAEMEAMGAWTDPSMFDDGLGTQWAKTGLGKRRVPRSDAGISAAVWDDFEGKVVERAKEQAGCRALQQLLQDDPTPEMIAAVHVEVAPHAVDLMMDPFGNYLVQVILEVCTTEQRGEFLARARTELGTVSLDMHGTRATQKLIETVAGSGDEPQMSAICAALLPELVVLVKDINGNHVVQKCLQCLPTSHQGWIFEAIVANCLDIATHRHGCCVVQRCLDHGDNAQRQALITEVFCHARVLITNAFGNYVIQYSIDIASPEQVLGVVNSVIPDVEKLACEKFSSNVLEKFLDPKNAPAVRERVVGSIVEAKCAGRLLEDSFGNYVMQKVVSAATEERLSQLLAQIRPVVPKLRESVAGQRILQKLSRRLPELGEGLNSNNRGRRWRGRNA